MNRRQFLTAIFGTMPAAALAGTTTYITLGPTDVRVSDLINRMAPGQGVMPFENIHPVYNVWIFRKPTDL